jgi:hypothetical protein
MSNMDRLFLYDAETSRVPEFTLRFFVGSVLLICLVFLCCPIMILYVLSFVLWCPLRFPNKSCSVRFYLQLFIGGFMSYLRYLRLFVYSGVQHTLCCVFVVFFCRLVYPMFLVSLDCLFCFIALRYSLTFICPVSCVPYVASFSGLSIFVLPFGIL